MLCYNKNMARLESCDGITMIDQAYRPPLAWTALLAFLTKRATPGVECVTPTRYARTLRVGQHEGWFAVEHQPAHNLLQVQIAPALLPVQNQLLSRVKAMFDVDADPQAIASHLKSDSVLASALSLQPGLRVPGACDGFELAVRAILGQQVSVAGATTLAGRVAARWGDPIETPHAALRVLFPSPHRLAETTPEDWTGLGITGARIHSLRALAQAVSTGSLALQPGVDLPVTLDALRSLPGIGDWTAHYIAMRALRWPDAFPYSDLGLRKACGGCSARELLARSEAWRPWRAYAAMSLWQSLEVRQ